MSRPRGRQAGVTLLELLVAMAVLGVMAGVVGLAWRPREIDRPGAAQTEAIRAIIAAGRRAVETGASVRVIVTGPEGSGPVVALPDGSMIGSERFGVDPLSGRPRRAESLSR